jgi:pyruvate/2-oxoglutarate dehydrogenase complex dihydrolipoamide dehydrogenase (E3) component
MERVRAIRQRVYDESDAPPNMERLGVEVIPDEAHFTDPHTVELGTGRKLTSRYFVIATGSRPRTLAAHVPVYTNETIFDIDALPARLAVVGAGPVGIELAQAFRRLGSEVTVIGSSSSILPRDDAELTAILRGTLESEGIRFQLGQKLEDNLSAIEADAVLAAIGRELITDGLQLEKAAIAFDHSGIRIDRRCRTSRRHIYAVGDVTGRFLFTHMAEHMAKVAVTNAILPWPRKLDYAHVAWCTFTDPELAHVGASEDDLKKDRIRFDVYRFPFSRLDRALTDDATIGMVPRFWPYARAS